MKNFANTNLSQFGLWTQWDCFYFSFLCICRKVREIWKWREGTQRFFFSFKLMQTKGYQMKSIHLGAKEGFFSGHFSVQLKMSSSFFLRDEIHLRVNEFSLGTTDRYLKVISISPIQQGRKGWPKLEKVYDVMNFDCRFLIHGWGSDSEHFFMVNTTEAYLENNHFNVIGFGLHWTDFLKTT